MRHTSEYEIRENADWSFETARFFIGLYAEEEELDPADSFELPEDIEFARSGRDGSWFAASVLVYLKSEDPYDWILMGRDHLGACSYNSVKEFYTTCRFHYFKDMVRIAIAEARRGLAHMQSIPIRVS